MRRWFRVAFFLLVIKPLLAMVVGINVFGREHLRPYRQCIVVANHNSHLDALTLMSLFPLSQLHRVHPVAAADYFMTNPLLAWVSTTLLNIIPIPRKGVTKSNNPLTKMGVVLDQGGSLIIFPEGTRGQPEAMAEFQSGIAHLIHKYPKIPVVPVFLRGLGRSLPKGEFLLVPFFCDAVIGPPQHYTGTKEAILHDLKADIQALKQHLETLYRETP